MSKFGVSLLLYCFTLHFVLAVDNEDKNITCQFFQILSIGAFLRPEIDSVHRYDGCCDNIFVSEHNSKYWLPLDSNRNLIWHFLISAREKVQNIMQFYINCFMVALWQARQNLFYALLKSPFVNCTLRIFLSSASARPFLPWLFLFALQEFHSCFSEAE